MSGPFGSSQWMYSSGAGGFYPTEIDQSLRFNNDDSAYLSRTPASAGNQRTWTWSCWFKRGSLGSFQNLLGTEYNTGGNYGGYITIEDTDKLRVYSNLSGTVQAHVTTNMVFRDVASYYHVIVVFDSTEASASDRVKIYVNGSLVSYTTTTSPSLNVQGQINDGERHDIGSFRANGSNTWFFDGYLSEVNFIDGQALDPTDFGEFKSGVWVAKSYAGSYGTNGFYLNFSDSANIGDDLSGNANDWTANNLVATDVVLDSPTQNWATLNPLSVSAVGTLQEGNLESNNTVSNWAIRRSTIAPTTGKWYCEFCVVSASNDIEFGIVDISSLSTALRPTSGQTSLYASYASNADRYYLDGGTENIIGSPDFAVSGNIVSIAYDIDAGTVDFYVNNTLRVSTTMSDFHPVVQLAIYGTQTAVINFGQDSSFAGNKTPQGNTDDNGIGDFYYAPPSGYLALCTANLPDPAIDPAQDDVPADYFNTVLYTGNGSTQSITGVGFQPDLVWIKKRNSTSSHSLTDVIRGVDKLVFTNSSNAEATFAGGLASFDLNGFSLASNDTGFNALNDTYVAWNWLAGNGTSSNSDGSISSTVSVNQKAGFSVVAYTAAGSTATVGHGLGAEPSMIIIKNRTAASGYNWNVYHKSIGNTQRVFLDTTSAAISGVWNNTSPTSSVFTIGGNAVYDSGDYIAYCFAEIPSYSAFGKYSGNGSADGPMIWTGFEPAVILLKSSSVTGGWEILDNARDPYNVAQKLLQPNVSNAEASSANHAVDFLSNGFKIRTSGGSDPAINTNGSTVIYAAWASNPFKYANAR